MSNADDDTIPPPPASPRDLMSWPARPPDWVDALAMRVAVIAARTTRDEATRAILPHLEGIERAVVDGFERVKADYELVRGEVRRLQDDVRALRERVELLERAGQ